MKIEFIGDIEQRGRKCKLYTLFRYAVPIVSSIETHIG